MPSITINGERHEFTPGEKILQVANRAGQEIPQYCYHPGLSIPAQCRICLAEVWAPNPRNNNKLEPLMGGKLLPTCATECSDGMVVYTNSPKAVANQKAVMEYLLINHPIDCAVCDQAGECFLQDYSYRYGRGVSRFEEQKVKNPKKDIGEHILLYSDRCILCTRCVRFAWEVSQTSELMIAGRGNKSEIDVFPGVGFDNELSGNVVDLCPVGALLDKDFLFKQRVWFLKQTPSIDGLTASGDNIFIEHNEGKVYRVKPRQNMNVNKWWITDEVRYGWKFVHAPDRLRSPMRRQYGVQVEADYTRAYDEAIAGLRRARDAGGRVALVVSPMLPCEEAYRLAEFALAIDPEAALAVGPVPFAGEDRHYPPSVPADDPAAFHVSAEKAPNARGVRRVLAAITGRPAVEFDDLAPRLGEFAAVVVTGNYPSAWATEELASALSGKFLVVIDTLPNLLTEQADVVLPGATWAEKAGTFENRRNMLQAFEAAIPVVPMAKTEGQIANDLLAVLGGEDLRRFIPRTGVLVVDEGPGQVPAATEVTNIPRAKLFNAAEVRAEMARAHSELDVFVSEITLPTGRTEIEADMTMVEL